MIITLSSQVLTDVAVWWWVAHMYWKECKWKLEGLLKVANDRKISLCEMYKVIPQLLRDFDLELLEPEKEWETHNYWFNKPTKVYTKVQRRQPGRLKAS